MVRHRASVASLVSALLTLGLAATAAAFTTELPPPNIFNSAPRGAFTVFSLPIIVLQDGGIVVDGQTQKTIQSSPGQISDELVLYTGPGNNDLNDNNAKLQICGSATNDCVDSPFPSPNGDASPTFGTDTSADPDPKFTGDRSNPVDGTTGLSGNTWDITLGALDTFLTGSNVPIFFFQHNQDNGGTAADQDVFGWGQIIISDIQGKLPDLCFNFNNNTTQTATSCTQPQAFTGRDSVPTSPTVGGPQGDFVFAPGQVCLDNAGGDVPCDGNQFLGPINHNLGANDFAYAIVSFGLNNFLSTCFADLTACGYDILRADFRLRELTNGFEQLIISQGSIAIDTPLPSALALVGLGMTGFGLGVWRRRLRAAAR